MSNTISKKHMAFQAKHDATVSKHAHKANAHPAAQKAVQNAANAGHSAA